MKALVTGGAGFIGSHVTNQLINNNIETSILVSGFKSDNHPSIVSKKANIIKGNLLHYDSLLEATKDIDVVFHIGGIVSHYCEKYPELTIDTNIKGTWNLKKACVFNNVNRIIFASSSFVYGNPGIVESIKENHPTNPKDLLGVTKLSAEKILQSAHPHKIDYNILRLFNVYGENQYPDELYTSVISTWIEKALNKEPLEIHDDGTQELDFIYVEDVAKAFMTVLMNEKSKNETFNIGSGIPISMKSLAMLINNLTDNNENAFFYNESHPMFLKYIQSDINKIRLLGWYPKVSLIEGLRKSIKFYKEKGGITY